MESEKGGNKANNAVDSDTPSRDLLTLDKPPQASSLQSLLEQQRRTIYEQIEELQRLAIMECQITGTNPLSQEMVAEVMGVKGVDAGGQYGEFLTPETLKYLFNVFSIKDTITKKEACEISGLCGATAMQVREFFPLQRSRVRRLMHQLHVVPAYRHMLKASDEMLQERPSFVDSCADLSSILDRLQESMQSDLKLKINNDHSNSKTVDIVEALLNLMQKENTFAGQSRLAQFIEQAHQGPVLHCFISKGGLPLISRWLTQAALEEQTSLLQILLQALANFPLGSAFLRKLSCLLQIVNKLRFYKAQGVAIRARLLLSRWSKFLRSGIGERISGQACTSGASQLQKRSKEHEELIVQEDVSKKIKTSHSCELGLDVTLCSSTEQAENASRPVGETVTAHGTPRKKLAHTLVLDDRIKERRKVCLFDVRIADKRAKDVDVVRPASSCMVSRPLSADEIQKAKRKACLLQSFIASKSQKTSIVFKQPSSSTQSPTILNAECSTADPNGQELLEKESTVFEDVNTIVVSEGFLVHKKVMSREVTLQAENVESSVSDGELQEINAVSTRIFDEGKTVSKAAVTQIFTEKCSDTRSTLASDPSNASTLNEILESGNAEATVHEAELSVIPWKIPPRIILDPRWSVAAGEESSEKIAQSIHLNNEQEAIYLDFDSIPINPGEPLEIFSLFDDDTNVPEILVDAVAEDSQECVSPVASDHCGEHTSMTEEEGESKLTILSKAAQEAKNSYVAGIMLSQPTKMLSTDTSAVYRKKVADEKSARLESDKLMPLTRHELMSDVTSDHLGKIAQAGSCSNKDQSRVASSFIQTHRKSTQHKHSGPVIGGMEKRSEKTSILSDKVKASVWTEQEHKKRRLGAFKNERDTLKNRSNSSLRKEKANISSKLDNLRSSHVEREKYNIQHHSVKAPSSLERLQQARILGSSSSHVDTSCTSGVAVKQIDLASKLDLEKASTSSEKVNINPSETNKREPQVPLGINLASLSKEGCFKMLRVVLQQLAKSSGDSGADLELLAVFLNNPDLVYALTSVQSVLTGKELAALTEALKGHNSKGNTSTSTVSQAGASGGFNSSDTSQTKSVGMEDNVSAVPSMPHSSLAISQNSTANTIPQSLPAGQLATITQAGTSMPSIQQVCSFAYETQCRQVQPAPNAATSTRPQFSQQSIFNAADRVLPKIMDTGKGTAVQGHLQSSGLLPLPKSAHNMGFLPTSPRPAETDGPTATKPGFENAQPPVITKLPSYNGLSSSLATEISGFRPAAQPAEAKGPLIASSPDRIGVFPSQAQQVRLDSSCGKHTVPSIPGPSSSVGGNSPSQDQGLVTVPSRAPNRALGDGQQSLLQLKEAHPRIDPVWKGDNRSQPLLPLPGSMQPQAQSSRVFEQMIRPLIPSKPPLLHGRTPTRPVSTRQPSTAPIIPVTQGDLRWHHSVTGPDGESRPRPSWRS